MTSAIIYSASYNGKSVEVIDARENSMECYNNMKKCEELAKLRKREIERKEKHKKRVKFINDIKFALGFSCVSIVPMFAMILHYCFTTSY